MFELEDQTYVWYSAAEQAERMRIVAFVGRGRPLIEKIQEPIEVLTKFVEGKIQPLRFRWRGRVFTVAEVTGTWIKRVGEHRAHFFSVGVGTQDYYEICYQARTCRWTLENIYLEG